MRRTVCLAAILLIPLTLAAAQENVPDAPSAKRPPASPLPKTTTPAKSPPPSAEPAPAPPPQPIPGSNASTARPRAARGAGSSREDIFTLTTDVNFVIVPVTVKDRSGRLVEGLLRQDFVILEDGVEQPLKLFTSDPFPLSAAVVIDVGLPDVELDKVRKTISSLGGAFAQFDEVSMFVYGNTVRELQEFVPAASEQLSTTLSRVRNIQGRAGGVAFSGGPLNTPVPTVNSKAVDPAQQPQVNVPTVTRESRVLNDAILAAAMSLSKRDRNRRKIIFVISDGREDGSDASYADVMKVLLSNEIAVYAVAVGGAAIPGYGTLEKIRIPGLGHGNILPKYASATGGEVFTEFTRGAIETAYSRVTEEARHQYTLGYTTRATPSSSYRSIEVRVTRGGLKVYAKDGYYPLPAARSSASPQSP